MLVFRQSMNRLWKGDELTKLEFDMKTWSMIGALIGGALVFLLDLNIHQALWIQAITCATANVFDMVFFKTMKKYERKD